MCIRFVYLRIKNGGGRSKHVKETSVSIEGRKILDYLSTLLPPQQGIRSNKLLNQ